jgi:multiple sugar transport system substrate-binding protein
MRALPLRILTVGAVAALVLSGCGRTTNSSSPGEVTSLDGDASGTVTMWAMGAEGEALDDFVTTFESANPDINVEVTAIPWDAAHDKIQTAIAGGTTPDLAMMGTTWMTDFAEAFAPVPSDVDTGSFFDSSVATTEVASTAVGIPWYVDTRVLYYRTDLAEKAGWSSPPTTWDELLQMATDLQAKSGAAYGIRLPSSGSDSFQNSLWLPWSNGAHIMTSDGSAWTLDTPEMVGAYEYLQGFFTSGVADVDADTSNGAAQAEFVAGTTPMFIDGPFNVGQLSELGGTDFADTYATAVLPTETSGTSFVGGANLVVFQGAQNPDGAWKLAQWLSEPQVQIDWWKQTGDLPAVQAAWDDPALAGDAKLAVFGQQLNDTQAPPAVPTWSKVAAAGDTVLEQITRGGVAPDEALENLQSQADAIGVG